MLQQWTADDFRAWRETCAFTRTQAAGRLGLSATTIANYEQGASPVPEVVVMAAHFVLWQLKKGVYAR